METPDRKSELQIGKLFLVFAGLCALALPLVVIAAFSYQPRELQAAQTPALSGDTINNFDHQGATVFKDFDALVEEYLQGTATARTLEEYYSRRQYLGAPPIIPHVVAEADQAPLDCLSCHRKGGWTAEMKRHTPITPHPEQSACRQCHIAPTADQPFVAHNWISVAPPRLGRAHLPGGPPPIPHQLQMRENCMACHVGPGAVAAIRVDHPSRGNCRQCHVPDSFPGLFER